MKKLLTGLLFALAAVAFVGCADKSKKADQDVAEQPAAEVEGSETVEVEATPGGDVEAAEGEEVVETGD